jgi:peptidoglycan/xylan/chitin deacetylase (PgdA/CDA1 family)
VLGLSALLGIAGAYPARSVSPATAAPQQTIVSLTFDDGYATEYSTRTMLSSRGMHATFFLNSPRIGGDSNYMTWPQINDLYADGNEIAGHTAYHPVLTQLDVNEAQREICYDRANLLARGFPVTNFAYPYGAYNATIENLASGCGYNSARTTNQFGLSCAPGCAESIPPKDAYATTIVANGVDGVTTIEREITNAEQNGGGWAQILFHQVCNGCSANAISPTDLATVLDWLQGQAVNGVVIETVAQVIGGAVKPAVAGPPLAPAPNGTNAIVNPSLELDANGDGMPDCFFADSWGNQTFAWTRTNDAHTGGFAERVDVSHFVSGDDKLLPVEDLSACTPTVTAGHQYRITEWYKSSVPVYFALFSRDSNWSWAYWTSSPAFPASSSWAQASWVTPVVPSTTNGVSGGLAIAQNGSLTVDDLAFDDANSSGGPTDNTPPTSTISCNGGSCASGWYAAPVSVTLSAADDAGGSGVSQIVYTTNGSDPSLTNGTAYAGAFTVGATATVKYRAYDNAGNAEAIKSQLLQIDTVAPTVAITAPTSGATVSSKKLTISASSSDTGSGVASVGFYADDKLLATQTASPYSYNWNLARVAKGQHTLTAVAKDRAGNQTTSAPVVVTVT